MPTLGMYQVRRLTVVLAAVALGANVASAVPVTRDVQESQFVRLDGDDDDDDSITTIATTTSKLLTSTSTTTSSTSTTLTVRLTTSLDSVVVPSRTPYVIPIGTGGKRNTAIAAGVVGTLAFLSLVAFIVYFLRRPLRRRFLSNNYTRPGIMTPASDPILPDHLDRGNPSPAMSEVHKTHSGSFEIGPAPSIPAPAFMRGSSMTASHSERNTFASVFAGSVDSEVTTTYGTPSPNLTPRILRRMSERFPIRVSSQGPQSPSSTLTMPLPLPPAKTDVEPALATPPASATAFTFQLPEIPSSPAMFEPMINDWGFSIPEARESSVGGSEARGAPRAAHKSWVNSQSKRIERHERLQDKLREAETQAAVVAIGGQQGRASVGSTGNRGSELSIPDTPAAFKQHPGMRVSFGVKHERLISEDLDRQVYWRDSDWGM